MSAEVVRLIEETRRLAPFSEDECRLMQLANALEDAEARVVLAKADALNAAAQWLEEEGWTVADQLRERAKAIEVGEI